LALRCDKWGKIIEKRVWSCQTPLRHFKVRPEDVLGQIEERDLAWEKYYHLYPQEVATWLKLPKVEKNLHRLIQQFPRFGMFAFAQPTKLVELTITSDFI
jgi:pre-mRNA-splicing helicase BRR2